MGYEVKLKIGWLSHESKEVKHSKKYKVDKGCNPPQVWFPHVHEKNGALVYTGRTERSFFPSVVVNLAKIGSGPLLDFMTTVKVKEKEPKSVIKWFHGNTERDEDPYGDRFHPAELDKVIEALEKQMAMDDDYCRFHWALAVCKEVQKNQGSFPHVVLFEGH